MAISLARDGTGKAASRGLAADATDEHDDDDAQARRRGERGADAAGDSRSGRGRVDIVLSRGFVGEMCLARTVNYAWRALPRLRRTEGVSD